MFSFLFIGTLSFAHKKRFLIFYGKIDIFDIIFLFVSFLFDENDSKFDVKVSESVKVKIRGESNTLLVDFLIILHKIYLY